MTTPAARMAETVQREQAKRCKEQGHEWENCCSITFELYQRCKWCGEYRDGIC